MKKNNLRQLILLQLIVIVYTCSSIMAKFAAMQETLMGLCFFFALDILFLGIYAIFWQQIIKKMDLSVAYMNRSTALFWSALWAGVFFHEEITVKQLVAVGLVIAGTVLVNKKGESDE